MPTNEFLPFAQGGGANVMSQGDFNALTARLAGFSSGTALSNQLNKVWRQSSAVSAMIGEFILSVGGLDALDNANGAQLLANFIASLDAQIGLSSPIGFISVTGFQSSPPGSPTSGQTYVVGPSATGAWAGHEFKIARWSGSAWRFQVVPTGHVVVNQAVAEGHADRYLRRTGAGWLSAAATDTAVGVARQATSAEVAARTPVSAFLTPDALDSIFITTNITRTINPGGGGDFTSISAALDWLRRRIPLRGVTVTLSLAGGIHSVTSDIVVDWPYGDQLRIIGATMSGADPAPADFATTGYGPAQRAADAATNATMLRARYNTELELNGASFIITGGLGLLDDVLLIRSGGTKIGLLIDGCAATLGTVSVHGMEADGIVLDRQAVVTVNAVLSSSDSDGAGGQYDGIEINDGSSLFGSSAVILAIGNAGPGFELAHRSYMFAGQARAHGNAMDGARVLWGSHVTVGNVAQSQFSTNGENGIELDVSASFNSTGTAVAASSNFLSGVWVNNCSFAFVPSMLGTSNGRYGLEVLMASSADATNAAPSSNTLGAFFANLGSTIENAGGSGTASPAVNTDGNSNSFIRR